jgi:hypothetical protein
MAAQPGIEPSTLETVEAADHPIVQIKPRLSLPLHSTQVQQKKTCG